MANPNKIPVLEIFGPTIQGEGPKIGRRTYFLRTAGCDYKCTRCDTAYSIEPISYKGMVKVMDPADIAEQLIKMSKGAIGTNHLVITGGNPALCDLTTLLKHLKDLNWETSLETQGSVWKEWMWAVNDITVSPKGPGMGCDPQATMAHIQHFMEQHCTDAYAATQITFKVPVFGAGDLALAVKLREKWPFVPMYLSAGNVDIPGVEEHNFNIDLHRRSLLGRIEWIHDLITECYPTLSDVFILPQLHVLIWGNKQGV